MENEQILCTRSSNANMNFPRAISEYSEVKINGLMVFDRYEIPRAVAEDSPDFKQFVVGLILTHGHKILLIKRLQGQAEARLHNLLSLTIGGHVRVNESLKDAALRELSEEIKVEQKFLMPKPYWVINDNSNAVGKVHIGVIYRLECQFKDIKNLEPDKQEISWIDREELPKYRSEMESWSQYIVHKIRTEKFLWNNTRAKSV